MKALSRIDGSLCGAILSTRPSATRAAAVSLRPELRDETRPPRAPAAPRCRRDLHRHARTHGAHCPQTASWLLSTFLPAPSRRPRSAPPHEALPCRQRVQRYSNAAAAASDPESESSTKVVLSKTQQRKLLHFVGNVDVRNAGTVEEHLELARDPYLNRFAQPEPSKIEISDREADNRYPSLQQAVRDDKSLGELLQRLNEAVNVRLWHPSRISLDAIYDLYLTLPEPRMIQMPAHLRHRLLKAFGTPVRRNSKSMLRYFSLIGEVKDSGIPLRRSEWNFALSLASRYVGLTTTTETEHTLQIWKEMERDAGVQGNDVTFNILFDSASKSGNFELAEMIYKEMRSRNIEFTRYHHVSLIHFFGLQGDGDGVRAAYKEMVEDGELVDSTVLNCVIASFLRCGEEAAAHRVYKHMKQAHSKAAHFPDRHWHTNGMILQVLKMFTTVSKNVPEMRPQLQELSDMRPDLQTYKVLIRHYGTKGGNLERIAQYLDEMKTYQIPVHGSIFIMLFKAFVTHGGVFESEWSPRRLNAVFQSLLTALDNTPWQSQANDAHEGIYLDTWLVIWALRAYRKCNKSHQAVLDVYDQLKSRWLLGEDQAQFLDSYVSLLLAGKDHTVFPKFVPKPKSIRHRRV
ncbi:Pentatricopeptide repeat-containing protein [Colletotrichum siamense]|uniref:Pentatricopeptide repeat-containing protein n=1 Tax=Colletotrichum siamense TaxID=690259 RepID=A0A9P5ET08_COLSI|nr:Pentatricopeptide repeat-containing protein [Colletotrichum siamense]KAF4859374.1 Pentatricopeptide repeat-containing protein [Colletotrichum siamense]